MFLFIKDWEGIKSCAKIYNEGVTIWNLEMNLNLFKIWN
jgi:hypothetical protein